MRAGMWARTDKATPAVAVDHHSGDGRLTDRQLHVLQQRSEVSLPGRIPNLTLNLRLRAAA